MAKERTPFERLLTARLSANGAQLPPDEEARKRWPNLWEWLTRTEVDERSTKETARLSVGLGLGCWEVSVMDPSLKMGLQASSRTLAGAFDALEKELTAPEPRFSIWKGRAVELRAKPKKEKEQ